MFMQCKVEDGECYLYDLGFRPTGTLEYKLLKRICGYDPLEMMIYYSLTGQMGNESISSKVDPKFRTPAFNVSCLSAPGMIKRISGLEDVRGLPGVEDVVVAHSPGETITEQMRGLLAQITVRVLGTVVSEDDLFPIMQKIHNTIHIISATGEEMLLPGIEYEDINGYIY